MCELLTLTDYKEKMALPFFANEFLWKRGHSKIMNIFFCKETPKFVESCALERNTFLHVNCEMLMS